MAELRKRNPLAAAVAAAADEEPEIEGPIRTEDLIHTGSTLLNLACSDRWEGGFGKGKVVNLVGESSTGKTLLALTCLAECVYDARFKDYDLFLDDAENALEFNLSKLFGQKAQDRIKSPRYTKEGEPIPSETIEDFYMTLMNKIQEETPFIYVLDSLDALSSNPEMERAYEAALKQAEGNEEAAKGLSASYKSEKARMASEILRVIKARIKHTDSLVIVISQTRDALNQTGYGPKKTRSGGKALKFYCTHEIWLTNVKTLKAKRGGVERIIGHTVQAKVSKNKITGKERDVQFNVYYSYGVDDLSSCCNFLATCGVLKKKGAKYSCQALGIDGELLGDIVKIVEKDKAKVRKVRELCDKEWKAIEKAMELDRTPRFR